MSEKHESVIFLGLTPSEAVALVEVLKEAAAAAMQCAMYADSRAECEAMDARESLLSSICHRIEDAEHRYTLAPAAPAVDLAEDLFAAANS